MKALKILLLFLITLINIECKNSSIESPKLTNWSVTNLPNNIQGYYKIIFLDPQNGCLTHGYTVDSNGNIIEQVQTFTNDGGKTWNSYSIEKLVKDGFRTLAKTPNGTLYATAKAGLSYTQAIKILFTSKDKGLSWQKIDGNYPNIDGNSFLYFTDETIGITSTVAGLHRTTDGGKTWVVVYTEQEPYNAAFFINSQIGFVSSGHFLDDRGSGLGVANNGSILKTKDSGKTWEKLNGVSKNVNSFFFLNESIGFVTMTNDNGINELFKTSDGGKTWIKINSNLPTSLDKMFFFSENKGVAFGGVNGIDFGIHSTANGGITWTKDIYLKNTTFSDASIINENNIFVLANQKNDEPVVGSPYSQFIILNKVNK